MDHNYISDWCEFNTESQHWSRTLSPLYHTPPSYVHNKFSNYVSKYIKLIYKNRNASWQEQNQEGRSRT